MSLHADLLLTMTLPSAKDVSWKHQGKLQQVGNIDASIIPLHTSAKCPLH